VEALFWHTHQHESTQRHPGAFLHFILKKPVHPGAAGVSFELTGDTQVPELFKLPK